MMHTAADPGVDGWSKRWDDTMKMVVYINEESKQRANCVDDILDAEREVALGLADEVCAGVPARGYHTIQSIGSVHRRCLCDTATY